MMIWLFIKLHVTIKKIFYKNAIYSFIFRKKENYEVRKGSDKLSNDSISNEKRETNSDYDL